MDSIRTGENEGDVLEVEVIVVVYNYISLKRSQNIYLLPGHTIKQVIYNPKSSSSPGFHKTDDAACFLACNAA